MGRRSPRDDPEARRPAEVEKQAKNLMEKGSGGASCDASSGTFFFRPERGTQKRKGQAMSKAKTSAKDVVASRGSCTSSGAGLSHYILVRKDK